jgi:hypothetical protein
MDNRAIVFLIPILAISVGLVAVIGHHIGNYLRMRHGYAPLNQNGKSEAPAVDLQKQIAQLKGDVDRLRGIEVDFERIKDRIAVLEKIATDPAARLANEIERLN